MCIAIKKQFRKERDFNAKMILKIMKDRNDKINCCTILKSVSSKEINRYLTFCKRLFFKKIYQKHYKIKL